MHLFVEQSNMSYNNPFNKSAYYGIKMDPIGFLTTMIYQDMETLLLKFEN